MSLSSLTFNPPIIAHRGASSEAPENTLAALRLAHAQHATWVEIDAKITSDGVPIIMHDDTLDRTTSGVGAVADRFWADMKSLDAGGWFNPRFKGERVPLLAEALRLILESGMSLNLEIKPCPGRDRATSMVVLIEISKCWPQDHPPPLLSSFSEDALIYAKQLQPLWPRSFAFDSWEQDWQGAAARIDVQAFSVKAEILTPYTIRVLKQMGLPILAYTVDDPIRAKELLSQGVDAIFCNNPKAMIAAL